MVKLFFMYKYSIFNWILPFRYAQRQNDKWEVELLLRGTT